MAKKTKGVIVVIADSKEPAKFDEFHNWYKSTHSPDIVATGQFYSSNTYVSPKGQDGKRLVAIHETEQDDIVKAGTEMNKSLPEWQQKGRIYGGMKASFFGRFKRIH